MGTWCPSYWCVSGDVIHFIQSDAGVCRTAFGGTPSSGGGGGLIDTIKGYLNDGIVIGGLVVAATAFIVVAIAAVTTFNEVRDQKAGWGKFGTIIVVGVVLIVAVVWLAGKSATIIF